MFKTLREFANDENGAVSVDHLVLTAAVVGLGLAVIETTSGGLTSASNQIATKVGSGIISTAFRTVATSDLNETAQVVVGEQTHHLNNAMTFAFKMEATLNPDDEGILFETGATIGSVLYQHDGKLYLQSGDDRSASRLGETVWDVSAGSYTIEGSLQGSDKIALFIDGQLVSQAPLPYGNVGGRDAASVGGSTFGVQGNRGNFRRGDTHPGVTAIALYKGQIIQ